MSSLKETLKSLSLQAGSLGGCVDTSGAISLSFTPKTTGGWGTFFTCVAPFDCICDVYIFSSSDKYSGFDIKIDSHSLGEANSNRTARALELVTYGIKKGSTISFTGTGLDADSKYSATLYPTVGSQS